MQILSSHQISHFDENETLEFILTVYKWVIWKTRSACGDSFFFLDFDWVPICPDTYNTIHEKWERALQWKIVCQLITSNGGQRSGLRANI